MTLLNPQLAEELRELGEPAATACFNCGTCAAICPLMDGHFPRGLIRYAQLGARERLLAEGQELWKCLHCGLCTQTCPREADPGEVILALKRYVLAAWREA